MTRPALFVTLALAASACGSNGSPTTPSAQTVAPTTLAVTCGATSLTAAGQQTQCQASVTLSNGTKQDQTNAAQWSSSAASVASISSTGLVTAAQPGTVTITATYQGASGTAALTVGGGAKALINKVVFATNTTKAIRGTTVHFDITGSTGTVISMNFGDGTTSSTPDGCLPGSCQYFEHVYLAGPGTYFATLRATDGFGLTTTAQVPVAVGDLSGVWTNAIVNPSNGRTETRVVTLLGDGTGSYTHPEGNSEGLTWSVNSYGSVFIKLNSGTISMDGIDLDGNGIRSDTTFKVLVQGGSADGLTLTFTKP